MSYSHADDRFATWLHRRLERFAIPAAEGVSGGRLAPVFIDRAELVAGPDLSAQVKQALAESAVLVVICSPAAAASRWVGQEIALYRAIHPDRPILAALIEGDPETAFPAALLRHGDQTFEPLAADFRKDGDGKRTALLKIVAGLTGLPLDRLVQRDVQARQRRVMAVTAAALVLSLVLATLLVIAMRERAEAQRQRADAEGMVEFMLTDLRDRLQGVGRLEIMDSVNRKAMEHYAADRNLDALPADMLERRARLITAMGEDDYDAGRTDTAREKFAAAFRITDQLMREAPDDPQRVFNHAQSEYWVGSIPFGKRNKKDTQPHWNAYLTLARHLVELEPGKTEWQREVGYAESNLCALAQLPPRELAAARQHCSAAMKVTELLSRNEPDNIETQLDHLNNIGWNADATLKSGQKDEALALRKQQVAVAATLPERFPKDVRAMQANLQVRLGLAQTYAAMDERDEARDAAQQALAFADQLRKLDPANKTWSNWRAQLVRLIEAR
ncbi:MAG: toll/interleukin-1 receptor domain-containing protein [Proteobacteria bacterium]|nr:toll/interleukin-1 receptor domain-containing protein [Pseudomonadota bacterium]